MVVIASSLLLGALVTAVWLREGTGVRTRLASALSLAGLVSLMVAALGGADPAESFQIDAHMLFFAMLALLAGWVDWRALVAFAGAVALHHLTLNIALPALVFPGGADFTRVLFHAVVLVIEAGALVWLTLRLEAAFSAASRSLAEAEEAGRESERMRKAQDDLAERERLRRTEVEAAIAGFRSEIETELSRVGDRVAVMLTAAEALQQNVGEGAGRAVAAGASAARFRRRCAPSRPRRRNWIRQSPGSRSRSPAPTASLVRQAPGPASRTSGSQVSPGRPTRSARW